MSDILTYFLFPLSIGGIGGFAIGYATKKIIKILMFLLGLYILSLYYLMNIGAIEINSQRLFESISSLVVQMIEFLVNTMTFLPLTGGFTVGFMLGIVKG